MGISITPPNVSQILTDTHTMGINRAWDSLAFYTADYAKLTGFITTEHASQADGVSLEFSNDGTNWFRIYSTTITEGRAPLAILTYDASGPTWFDQTLMESPFSIVPLANNTTDFTYVGYDKIFKGITLDINTAADMDAELFYKFWDGVSWAPLTVTDGTSELTVDGTISFTPPDDWRRNVVNGVLGYFIQIGMTSVDTFGSGAIVATITIESDETTAFTTDNIAPWARFIFENGETGQDISILINGRRQ